MRNARSRLSTYTPDDLDEGCSRDVSIRDTVLKPVTLTESPAFSTKRPRLNHYTWHIRIKMRSGACAASREDVGAGKGEE
jgi:hypothetical protein